MKAGIHPDYKEAKVTCSCGNTFTTRSTVGDLHAELCNECHPFYTGKQKLVDSGGRVERFQRRYGKKSFTGEDAKKARAAAKPAPEPKVEVEAADAPKPEAAPEEVAEVSDEEAVAAPADA